MRNSVLVLLSAICLCAGMSVANATELPCFVHQVARTVESGTSVAITGMPAGTGACQYAYDAAASAAIVVLQYQLQRQDQNGEFTTVGYLGSSYKLDGTRNRRTMLTLGNLEDGQYRLITVNGGAFLEALHFSVGGIANINNLDLAIPYVQPMAVVHGGFLYFRAHLGRTTVASGYLYQRAEMLQTDFSLVDPQGDSALNQPSVRGGILDLPLVRARLLNNSFDPNRPIQACLTADGGGVTACFVVYDPNSPMKLVTDGFSPSR